MHIDSSSIGELITGALVLAGLVTMRWFHVRHVQAAWFRSARRFGLSPEKVKTGVAAWLAGPRAPLSFAGQYAGFDVRVARRVTKEVKVIDVSIGVGIKRPRSGIPTGVGFRRKDARTFFGKWASEKELIIMGDPAFDSSVSVSGPEPVLRALADEPCRARMLQVFRAAKHSNVSDGCLRYQSECRDVSAVIERLLVGGIELAKALCMERAELPSRLAANARSADLAQIRIAALHSLSLLPGAQERTRQTALALLDDPDPEMRVRVAMRFGAADIDRLLSLSVRECEPLVRAGLLEHLSSFAGPRLWPAIREALRSGNDAVLRAAGKAAAATGLTDVALEIARSLESRLLEAAPETLVSLVGALNLLRDPATEPALVRVLSHESKEVQRSAASALGEFGSVAAVETLLERSEHLLFDRETKTTLLTAVARIQGRVGIVQVGTLSLAELGDETGALSLAEPGDETGALSLVDDSGELAASSSAARAEATKANK